MAKFTRLYVVLFASVLCSLGGVCVPAAAAAQAPASTSSTTPIAAPFALASPSPRTLSLMQGQAGMATLALESGASFHGEIKLRCTGTTPGLQCLVSPQSITLQPGESREATIAVATQGSSTSNLHSRAAIGSLNRSAEMVISAAGLCCLLCFRRRAVVAKLPLFLGVSLVGMFSVSGCAARTAEGTPLGKTSLMITATSGLIVQTQVLVITVEQP